MTRKKWNRLRRQRPELFARWPGWDGLDDADRRILRPVGKSEAITAVSAWILEGCEIVLDCELLVNNPEQLPVKNC